MVVLAGAVVVWVQGWEAEVESCRVQGALFVCAHWHVSGDLCNSQNKSESRQEWITVLFILNGLLTPQGHGYCRDFVCTRAIIYLDCGCEFQEKASSTPGEA